MEPNLWIQEFPGAITVCDTKGIILEMNEAAIKTFEKYGGKKLIGASLLDCHPEPARTKLKKLLETQEKNVYTIQKQGVKKIIYQSPWYKDGIYSGFVEFSLEIPSTMPHFIRDGK